MNWKNSFKDGKELILATSSPKNMPHANIVISLGFVDDKLLVANCQMSSTIKHLQKNKNICVVGGYFRIKGKVDIFSSGKYFDYAVKKSKGHCVKNAILVTISEVFDLDKVKKVL